MKESLRKIPEGFYIISEILAYAHVKFRLRRSEIFC